MQQEYADLGMEREMKITDIHLEKNSQVTVKAPVSFSNALLEKHLIRKCILAYFVYGFEFRQSTALALLSVWEW